MNTYERWNAEERYTQLAADAICAHHPLALKLARMQASDMDDDLLLAACSRLARWLDRHATPGTQGHQFLPLSGSQDEYGVYQQCGVNGCRLTPSEHLPTPVPADGG